MDIRAINIKENSPEKAGRVKNKRKNEVMQV